MGSFELKALRAIVFSFQDMVQLDNFLQLVRPYFAMSSLKFPRTHVSIINKHLVIAARID